MSLRSAFNVLERHQLLIGGLIVVCLYAFYISSLSSNPPGFYVDESCLAYNGYLVGHTGVAENGDSFPLYFQCYTQGYSQWANPTHVYLLAVYYLFVPPSNLSSRIFAATLGFLAALLMGFLATRLSGKRSIGAIVALSAMFTPWLFDISRLVLETFFYPLAVALFLFCLYNAYRRGKWSVWDMVLIAVTLALITYSYTIGRLLGPMLAFGLLIFVIDLRSLVRLIVTWIIYAILLIPLLVTYLTNSAAITQRFSRATNLSMGRPIGENVRTFITAYLTDLSPWFLIIDGDLFSRHHLSGTGEFLVGTFALAVLGIFIILFRHYSSRWWLYILFGLAVSVIPGSLTLERHHSLRMVAFPVFFLMLLVPALSWLLENKNKNTIDGTPVTIRWWNGRRLLLIGLLMMTALQALMFQLNFRTVGGDRLDVFDAGYPNVLKQALAMADRPIYLEDGGIPAYVHAYWYAMIEGVDRSNFVHLLDYDQAPEGAMVLSSKGLCSNCEVITQDGNFILYRNHKPVTPPGSAPSAIPPSPTGQLSKPRGIAADSGGNYYVADTGNSRVQKFDIDGNFIMAFGRAGEGEGEMREPQGVAVSAVGEVYVTDALNHKLLKFKPDGTFEKEWTGAVAGFYGPRDLDFGPDGSLYIVDQGRTRIARLDHSTQTFFSWGTPGSAEGQFNDASGISIGGGFVFVTDTGNGRVQVFDLYGTFVRQWPIPQWEKDVQFFTDVAFDEVSQRVYVSSGKSKEILAFDLDGNQLRGFKPVGEAGLQHPLSMVIVGAGKGRRLLVLDTVKASVSSFDLLPK